MVNVRFPPIADIRDKCGYVDLMADDLSNGWDAIAERFVAARSNIGAGVVRQWTSGLPPGGAVLDLGCGSGVPISKTLLDEGFEVFGVDASPALLSEFRRRFPSVRVACEAVESSSLFEKTFAGAVAIGLMFLLPADAQREVIRRVKGVLQPGGRFLFSAPRDPSKWNDILTGRESLSLGEEEYRLTLQSVGMKVLDHYLDEGENYYFDAVRLT